MKNITYTDFRNDSIYNIENAYFYHNQNKVNLIEINWDKNNINMVYALVQEKEYQRWVSLDTYQIDTKKLLYLEATTAIQKVLEFLKRNYEPIDNFQDLEKVSKTLQEIVDTVITSGNNMAFIDKDQIEDIEDEYDQPWEKIEKTLLKEKEKYKLEGVLEIGDLNDSMDDIVIGYGDLQTMFKFKPSA